MMKHPAQPLEQTSETTVYPAKDKKRGSVGIDLETGIRQHLITLSNFPGPPHLPHFFVAVVNNPG